MTKSFTTVKVRGQASCAIQLYLTIELRQTSRDGATSMYQGKCSGTVSCFALSKTTLKIVEGEVSFFSKNPLDADSSLMVYDLEVESIEGTRYSFHGEKCIDSTIAFSISKTWTATTSVHFTIIRANSTKLGSGVAHISLSNFCRQMRTFKATTPLNITTIIALLSFFLFFAQSIMVFFLRPFTKAQFPMQQSDISKKWKKMPSTTTKIKAQDGVELTLEIFSPSNTESEPLPTTRPPPILFLPGVTGPGAPYHLFALPFTECNMATYFTRRGHCCYALTPRWGNMDGNVAARSTVYDCRLDVAAALAYITSTEQRRPYVVAHCQGSVALGIGLLDGTIAAGSMLGVTANSVFINEVFSYWNALKGRTTALIRLYEVLAGNWFPVATSNTSPLFQRLLDILLRFYPVRHRRDICTSSTCHRCSFGFGLLWNHENLDKALHDNIHTFFAGTHTNLLRHVVRMGTAGQCLDDKLRPLMAPKNIDRLRGLPILFISGTDNEVFDPETTLRDYEMLRRHFGEENYRRFLPQGYGHLDPILGLNADQDVYWRIFEHLKRCHQRVEGAF
jgi:hypothetical protein